MGRRFIVFVFVKAPVPGRVKTRLAASLGSVEAARLYRSLAHRIVERVAAGGYRTVVYFDPPRRRGGGPRVAGGGAGVSTPAPGRPG